MLLFARARDLAPARRVAGLFDGFLSARGLDPAPAGCRAAGYKFPFLLSFNEGINRNPNYDYDVAIISKHIFEREKAVERVLECFCNLS